MAKDLERYRRAEALMWDRLGVTPVERRVMLASGGAVRVQELGSGDPVLFIHGASVAGTSWCKIAAALDGSRCILLDRPGCGLSDPIVGGPLRTLDDVLRYADGFLPDVLDALELDRAAVLSTSYGGLFAFRGAAAAPERVDRIVEYSWLMGAPMERPRVSMRMGALPGTKAMMGRMPITRGIVKALLRQLGMKRAIATGTFDDDMIEWLVTLLQETDTLRNDMQSMPDLVTPIRGTNRKLFHSDELLARLTMPVLFLWGDEDTNGGADVAREFSPRLPDAQLEIIPEAGHAPWFDELELCVRWTREFLAA